MCQTSSCRFRYPTMSDHANSLHVVSNNWSRAKYRVVGKHGEWKLLGEISNSKDTEYPAPEDHDYPSAKFVWNWQKAYKCWEMKPNKQGGNLISLDTWIEHPQVEEILTNPDIIDEIIYFGDRFGGKEITLEEAIENSRNVDPNNKPESKLPGKRKSPDTPPTAAGSTSGIAKTA